MKITIINKSKKPIGTGGRYSLGPGGREDLEVTEDELAMWQSCDLVEVCNTNTGSSARTVSETVQSGNDKGRKKQNNEVGTTPKRKRTRGPNKVKP